MQLVPGVMNGSKCPPAGECRWAWLLTAILGPPLGTSCLNKGCLWDQVRLDPQIPPSGSQRNPASLREGC